MVSMRARYILLYGGITYGILQRCDNIMYTKQVLFEMEKGNKIKTPR